MTSSTPKQDSGSRIAYCLGLRNRRPVCISTNALSTPFTFIDPEQSDPDTDVVFQRDPVQYQRRVKLRLSIASLLPSIAVHRLLGGPFGRAKATPGNAALLGVPKRLGSLL